MSFTGAKIEIPLGQDGLSGSANMSQVPPGALLQATNLSFEGGVLQKEGGASRYSASPVAGGTAILGGHDWWPTPLAQRLVVFTAFAELYRDSGDGVWAYGLGNSGDASQVPVFVEGGQEAAARDRKLFVFNAGGTFVLKGDATTTYWIGGAGVAQPSRPSAALASPAAAGNLDNGVHTYVVAFEGPVAGGISITSEPSNSITIADKTVNGQVVVTIPLGPTGTTKRHLYRTPAGNVYPHKYLTTIGDNTTTTYTDNVADAGLLGPAATVSTFSAAPYDWYKAGGGWPRFGFLHANRLFAGGSPADPHRLYYSLLTDHEDFIDSGAGSLSVYPGEGERLIGGLSFKGIAILWKYPRGIYALDTSDPSPANWSLAKISGAVGGVSPRGQVAIDDDVLFLDATGALQLLSGLQQFGDLGSRNLSQTADLGPFVRREVERAALSRAQAVYYVNKREVHIALCGTREFANNNRRLVVDWNQLDKPKFRWSTRDSCPALWLQKDDDLVPRLMAGDAGGEVWQLDEAYRHKANAAYEARFQTAHTDFGYADPALATKRKNGRFLELAIEPRGLWDLTVNVIWDGELRQTIPFRMDSDGVGLDTFVLDRDRLAGDSVVNKRKRVVGSGQRFSIEAYNGGAGQDFSIARAWLYLDPSDERL